MSVLFRGVRVADKESPYENERVCLAERNLETLRKTASATVVVVVGGRKLSGTQKPGYGYEPKFVQFRLSSCRKRHCSSRDAEILGSLVKFALRTHKKYQNFQQKETHPT